MKEHVRVIKDMPELKLAGRQLGPFSDGEEITLWSCEAVVLERHGIVVPTKKPTISELRKLVLTEERSSGLATLPENFYSSAMHETSNLKIGGDLEKADGLKAQTMTLLETRLPKLLRLALSPESLGEMPLEERFLVNRLVGVLESWNQGLNDLFEKIGEEAGKDEFGRSVRHVAGDEADIQKPRVPTLELHT